MPDGDDIDANEDDDDVETQVEMDSIVDQMMSVAEMLGWETTELRPVTNTMMMMMMMMMAMMMRLMTCKPIDIQHKND